MPPDRGGSRSSLDGAARQAAARFGWAPTWLETLHRGHIHDSWVLGTARGRYLLQRINRTVVPDVAAVTANVVTLCRHAGDIVPQPVPVPDGGWSVRTGGEWWRAFRFVDGGGPPEGTGPAPARSAGLLLGTFHARTADLDPDLLVETLPGFHDPGRRLRAFEAAVAADRCGRAAAAADEIAAARDAASLTAVADDLVHELPRRVAHNDAKLDNMVFRRGRAVCLVDLDTVMPGAWLWDVGDLLRTAATTAAEDAVPPAAAVVDPAQYRAVVAGYRHAVSAVPVQRAELDALEVAGALVTYEQALRFLTDWLAGDVYYRTTRAGQNLDRARAQLHLLATMPR